MRGGDGSSVKHPEQHTTANISKKALFTQDANGYNIDKLGNASYRKTARRGYSILVCTHSIKEHMSNFTFLYLQIQ